MTNFLRKFSFFFIAIIFILSFLIIKESEASVVLKVMAVNPSKENTQRVSVKAYLPKETRPEDIINKGDLEVAFDNQQGSYYIYGEYDLKPGESVEKEVELRDIWFIQASDIEALRLDAAKLSDMLKNTEFSDRISFLKNSIDSKLNQIIENQKSSPANPERHISDHRENLKVLESAKADLTLARNLLSQIKPMPAVTVWKLIIAIVIFLGILGASFYIIWQKQAKVMTQDTFYVPHQEDRSSEDSSGPEKHDAEGEKTLEPKDIEDMIKKDEDK